MSTPDQNLGRKEQRLVKASTFGVPASEMEPYIEFLDHRRRQHMPVVQKAEDTVTELEMMLEQAKTDLQTVKSHQDSLDLSYQHALAWKANPHNEGKDFQYYATKPAETDQHEGKGVLSLTGSQGTQPAATSTPTGDDGKKGSRAVPAERLEWNKMAEAVLRKIDDFITVDRLLDEITKLDKKYTPKNRSVQINNFIVSATREFAAHSIRKRQFVLAFGDEKRRLIGLVDWANDKLEPKPEYLKKMMAGNNNNASDHNLVSTRSDSNLRAVVPSGKGTYQEAVA